MTRNEALAYIDAIDSTWKGHEHFAIWLVKTMRPKTIVDLGFDRGLSTMAFGFRNRGNTFAIDWFEDGNYFQKCRAIDKAYETISTALRVGIVKNVHLILGPFDDVSKKWDREVDLLHIDHAHSYERAKLHFEQWKPFLKPKSVLLVHDILSKPNEVGRFFHELDMPKLVFPHDQGLGIATWDSSLLELIRKSFF